MKLLLKLFILLSTSNAFAQNTIFLNISPNGYPPYMIKNTNSDASGIMVDILRAIAQKKNYKVKAVEIPKKRILKSFSSGVIDASPNAKEWVEDAHNYAFSDVILTVNDILFSRADNPILFNDVNDLFGKKIGTHLGYNYPDLEPYFRNDFITKTETHNELTMLKVTLSKRNDASIITDRVGKWLIKNNPDLHNKFSFSEKTVNSFEYRMMFAKKWQPFVNIFNKELALMKKSGEFNQILARYN